MNELIENRDIVIVGLQPWDVGIGSNRKDIAFVMCKQNRVLSVDSPTDLITVFKKFKQQGIKNTLHFLRQNKPRLVEAGPNLWVFYPGSILLSVNRIGNRRIFNFLNRINNKIISRGIKKAIRQLNFRDIILFNDNDILRSYYLKDFLNPQVSIYYSRDYLMGVDYWKKQGTFYEPALIAKSDLCVANSSFLAEYCKKYNPLSYNIGQGYDPTLYNNEHSENSIPDDISRIKNPIVGYTGFLTSLRLDISLLLGIAAAMPDYNFVLVGPEDEEFRLSQLHNVQNVFFLGSKNPELVPLYIKAFDVCINPQLKNEITLGNYPRKIDEYLAMGKPVVATNTPAMDIFEEHVLLADSITEYAEMIHTAAITDNDNLAMERIKFVGTHTWENNVKEIYKAIRSAGF